MNLDSGSRAFLSVVYSDDVNERGRATTREIRRETGLTIDQMQYRYEKLPAENLITVDREEEPLDGGGRPQRIAVLTDKGRTLIQKGDINLEADTGYGAVDDDDDEVSVSRTEIQEQREEISKLVERVNSLSNTVTRLESASQSEDSEGGDGSGGRDKQDVSEEDIAALRQRIETLESDIETVTEQVEACASAMRLRAVEEDVQELQSYVDDIGPWTGLTEMYLRALNQTFQEEFDIDIGQKSTDMFREDILHRDMDELSPSLRPLVEQERERRSGTEGE